MSTELYIKSNYISMLDKDLVPTGDYLFVGDTPFDFRKSKLLSQDIDASHESLKFGNGYDHNFVLDTVPDSLEHAATAYNSLSGISMEVFTTEPAIQLYTANWLDGTLRGKSKKNYKSRSAFCLETQHFPDSPNNENFPSTVLKKGQQYQSQTAYKFGVRTAST